MTRLTKVNIDPENSKRKIRISLNEHEYIEFVNDPFLKTNKIMLAVKDPDNQFFKAIHPLTKVQLKEISNFITDDALTAENPISQEQREEMEKQLIEEVTGELGL